MEKKKDKKAKVETMSKSEKKKPSVEEKENIARRPNINERTGRGKRRDTSKVTCFLCHLEGHYRYQCPQKKEHQERERKINTTQTKVRMNAVNQWEHNIEGWKDEELLPVVNLNIMG